MAVLATVLTSIKIATAVIGVGKLALLPFLLVAMAYFHYDIFDPENRPFTVNEPNDTYDFVIIGSGSAGAIVANRLSEIKDWKILLLEAGGHETEISDVPLLSLYLHKSKLDWGYRAQPQNTACLAMRDKRCSWTRGKVLGGSSVLNTMLYVRGNKQDYDHWEELGNLGWGYESILPYFLKSEDQRNPYLAKNKRYHNTGGYVTVQESPYNTPLGIAFLQAAQEMGYQIRDINGEHQTGFALFQMTMRRGTRCSTAKAFLRPIRQRKNLHVSLYSHVTKLLINPETKHTYGVEFIKDGKVRTVKATREVILSAGAINTPHLLMLSGIGPQEHLQEIGIPLVHDSPGVGQNLQDHIAVGGLTFLVDHPISNVLNRMVNINSVLRYAVNERGPLTSSIGLETVGFIPTKYANKSQDFPDIEFMMLSASPNNDGGSQSKHAHGLSDSFYEEVFKPVDFRDSYSIYPMILRPKSRGFIKLHSKNPLRYPLLYHNYLTHPHDVMVLREGVKAAMALSETVSMKRFGTRYNSIPIPGCKHLPQFTDEYWDCCTRQYTLSIYHYSCTAKMGPPSDPWAVVDPTLRVYGVSGLRVVDASVMPVITSGNIQAPVMMIAEKASDMIKGDWLNVGYGKRRKRELQRALNESESRLYYDPKKMKNVEPLPTYD